MGVPKFYRWISQRYPCINQIVKDNEVVPIDHVYLDLNGIIHSSSHCDGMAFDVFDESKVFQTIANYINYIINLIKPRKTIFLAVDGVAPRAKMTQQRARRFVGPKKVADEIKKRKEKGQKVDETTLFDSNVISPGTEFMARLHEFFMTYITNQINSNPIWRRADVIYSGHDAPGEGEQKIREYMSYKRALPGYLPNERHCLYGMDADLIFLGLATHEPNLCILRENVFTVKSPVPQNIPFCLIHLSLLREYIGLEFGDLKNEISFPFDLERIIDDWIFMGYLLGNDFIPNLPNMHIHAESFIFLWDTYHVVLPKLDGYINEFGKLNLERFHVFITELASFDMLWFAESQADQRWMHGKHGAKMAKELQRLGKEKAMPSHEPSLKPINAQPKAPTSTPEQEEDSIVGFFGGDDPPVIPLNSVESVDEKLAALMADVKVDIPIPSQVASLEEIEPDLSDTEDGESCDLSDSISEDTESCDFSDSSLEDECLIDKEWLDHHRSPPSHIGADSIDSEEDEDTISYRMHRQEYYSRKLEIDIRGTSKHPDESFVEAALLPICQKYVETLQWVLDYYFNTVADWQHYYPYHYAPFVSDLLFFTKRFLKDGLDYEKRFNWTSFVPNTKPLLPFEQQMFIMPISSAKILPQPYRCLFAEESPVAEFFPDTFQTDINGKLADWEAVVLIPFIDEAKMLAAMAPLTRFLSPEDAKRNIHRGHKLLMASGREKFNFEDKPTFEDLLTEEVDGEFYRSRVLSDPEQCVKVYCQLSRPVHPTYPSFYRVPFTSKTEHVGVTTFSFASKGQSILLTVNHPLGRNEDIGPVPLRQVAKTFLGHPVYTGWPYSRLVLPIAVLDEKEIWEVDISSSKTRLINRTNLRQQPDSPFWSSLKWLQSQSELCVSRLYDRCAITLVGRQPRAALLCLPVTDAPFSISVNTSDRSLVHVSPMCLKIQHLTKQVCEIRSQHHASHKSKGTVGGGPRANKQSLCHDSNVSIAVSSEATLEILDLTVEPSSTAAFDRALFEVFSRADKVIIFDRPKSKNFGRLGEVVNTTVDNKLRVKLLPKMPPPKDPDGVLEMAVEADDACFLTVQQISRKIQLTQHIIQRLLGDFMVRVPQPNDHNPVSGNTASRPTDDRRNFANLGFNLRLHNDRAFVVGWSHFSTIQHCWMYSDRTVEALAEYNQLFPDLVHFIASFDMRKPPPKMSSIYQKDTFDNYVKIRNFLRTKVKINRTVTDVGAPLLNSMGLSIIEKHLLPDQPAQPYSLSKSVQIKVAPTDVFALLPEGGRVVPKAYQKWLNTSNKTLDKFNMLDRIVYVGPRHDIFGLGGFIVGIYPILGEETIEVMFDLTFDGAVSTRGSSPRCMVVPAAHLLHYPHARSKAKSKVITVNKSNKMEKPNYENKPSTSQHPASFNRQKHESTPIAKSVEKEYVSPIKSIMKEKAGRVGEPSTMKQPSPMKRIPNAELLHSDTNINRNASIPSSVKQFTPSAKKMQNHVLPSNQSKRRQQRNRQDVYQSPSKPNPTSADFGSPEAPSVLPPLHWQMAEHPTMFEGGLFEIEPSFLRSQSTSVTSHSSQVQSFTNFNGSLDLPRPPTQASKLENGAFMHTSKEIPMQAALSSANPTFQCSTSRSQVPLGSIANEGVSNGQLPSANKICFTPSQVLKNAHMKNRCH
nr:5' 3' exoribonuclease 1 [Hymenolepis microstoma]